ncbi:hypothetical protein DH2020_003661 [Rehmannia glutinosa]|uniref:Uncharacterized protein n=1 Tax=Rehmannia glutinosa TaxID=99300 RepID=A0ABR0XMF2_REHGL
MGLSNFPSPGEGVLPLIVMNTVMSVALVKNKLRSVLQVGGGAPPIKIPMMSTPATRGREGCLSRATARCVEIGAGVFLESAVAAVAARPLVVAIGLRRWSAVYACVGAKDWSPESLNAGTDVSIWHGLPSESEPCIDFNLCFKHTHVMD